MGPGLAVLRRRGAAAQGLAHEFVGQDEARVAEIGEGQAHNPLLALLHVGQLDPDHVAFGAADEAAETLAAVEGRRHLDLGVIAGPTVEVARPHERPVDARG